MRKILVGGFVALLCSPAMLMAAWRLDFDVAETRRSPQPAKGEKTAKVEELTYRLSVWLASDLMVIAREQSMSWWDFKARSVTTLDTEAGKFVRENLLATLGFREAEFQNRLRMQAAFAATGIKDNPFDSVLTEHLFSRRVPNAKAPVKQSVGGRDSWSHAGKLLFAAGQQGEHLTAENKRLWIRFVSYQYGLHPDVIIALEQRDTVPAEMEIGRFNISEDRLVLKLQAAHEDAPPEFARVLGGAVEAGRVVELANKAEKMDQAAFAAACDQLKAQYQAAQQEGRVFEALLLLLEWGLWTDASLPDEIAKHRDQMQKDPECAALLSSLNPHSKVEAEAAVATLLQLENKETKGKRVLRIFRANTLSKLGKVEEARRIFSEVLAETPANVGAWKDLGDLYYMAYEMPDAWRCWDAAKHLLPTHKNLRPVLEMEARLIAANPELL